MKSIILFLTVILLCMGCSKSDDSTSPNNPNPDNSSGNGRNGKTLTDTSYFIAKINGRAFEAKNEVGSNLTLLVFVQDMGIYVDSLKITVDGTYNTWTNLENITFTLLMKKPGAPGTFAFGETIANGHLSSNALYVPGNPDRSIKFVTDNAHTGTATIYNFNPASKTISGTFSFKAKDQNGTEVTITDGAFEFHNWLQ